MGDKEHAEDEHVVCKEEGMQKFNCNGTYCSEVKCFNPKTLCEERYSQLNLQTGKPHCHISCMSNGRCQPGIFKNTPNANLNRQKIFKKVLKMMKAGVLMRHLKKDLLKNLNQ